MCWTIASVLNCTREKSNTLWWACSTLNIEELHSLIQALCIDCTARCPYSPASMPHQCFLLLTLDERLHFLGIPHHLASRFVDGPSNHELSTAPSSLHHPRFTIKFTTERLCPFVSPAVRYVQVGCACLTRSFPVPEHMQSQTGAVKTVNKGPWHHLGRREEHIKEPRPERKLETHFSSTQTIRRDIFISNWLYSYRCHSAMSRHLGQAASH